MSKIQRKEQTLGGLNFDVALTVVSIYIHSASEMGKNLYFSLKAIVELWTRSFRGSEITIVIPVTQIFSFETSNVLQSLSLVISDSPKG